MIAVVVTYNRRDLLGEALAAVLGQSRAPDAVIVVDNASTDGTAEAASAASAVLSQLPVHHLRLPRNGGCAEGNHFGIGAALAIGCDWVWLLDDDAEPASDCLERLLAAPAATRAATALLAPRIVTAAGATQLLHRGTLARRLLLSPMRPLTPDDYHDDAPLGFASYLGVLVRSDAIREAGPPRREMFVWMDDVDFTERLSHVGELRLIASATVRHHERRARTGEGLAEQLRTYARPLAFAGLWKNLYGLRNLIAWGRRTGYVSSAAAACYVAEHLVRALLFDGGKLRRARLILAFARQGWRGEAFNVDPATWPSLETARDPVGWLREHAIDHTIDYGPPVALEPR